MLDSGTSLPKHQHNLPHVSSKRPPLFLYSLLVPTLWLLIGGVLHWIAPTLKLGAIGLFLILYCAVWIICWHFTKNFSRHFHRRERIKLILLTTTWAVLVESLALWTVIDDRTLSGSPGLSTQALIGLLTFTFAFDAFMMWASYTFVAKRIVTNFLGKIPPQVPN